MLTMDLGSFERLLELQREIDWLKQEKLCPNLVSLGESHLQTLKLAAGTGSATITAEGFKRG